MSLKQDIADLVYKYGSRGCGLEQTVDNILNSVKNAYSTTTVPQFKTITLDELRIDDVITSFSTTRETTSHSSFDVTIIHTLVSPICISDFCRVVSITNIGIKVLNLVTNEFVEHDINDLKNFTLIKITNI